MAIGWINKNTDETAAQFKTRMEAAGNCFAVSERFFSSIAYSAEGLTIRQGEHITEYEVRGLSREAAVLLLDLNSDTTQTTVYYRQKLDGSDYVAVGLRTGDLTTVSLNRANEANGWTARIQVKSLTAADAAGWATTRPSAASASGILTGKNVALRIFTPQNSTQDFERCTTEVRVFKFLTYAEAVAKCTASNTVYWTSLSNGYFRRGAETQSSMNYIDGVNGYTVTQVTKTYQLR